MGISIGMWLCRPPGSCAMTERRKMDGMKALLWSQRQVSSPWCLGPGTKQLPSAGAPGGQSSTEKLRHYRRAWDALFS